MRGYSLVLSTPLAQASLYGTPPYFVADVTNEASDWKRTVRAQGGFWLGSFSLPVTAMALDGFDRWLGCHVTERSGGCISWEGMVYELELSQSGLVKHRSLDSMRNYVRVDWTDLSGNDQSTAWATNASSISTFGRKEEILSSNSQIDAEVEKYRDIYLARYGWPWGEPTSICPPTDSRLTVQVCGYVFTLNWRHVGATALTEPHTGGIFTAFGLAPEPTHYFDNGVDLSAYATAVADQPAHYTAWTVDADSDGNIIWAWLGELDPAHFSAPGANDAVFLYDTQSLPPASQGTFNGTFDAGDVYSNVVVRGSPRLFISDILANDSEFVTEGILDEPHVSIDRDIEQPERCWDAIVRGMDLGDYADSLWQAWVGPDRHLNYNAISTTPSMMHHMGVWRDVNGALVNPWLVRPCMVRDMAWKYDVPRAGYWIPDPRDFFVSEFEVDAEGTITPLLGLENETYMNKLAQSMGWEFTPNEGKVPVGYWYWSPETGWTWTTEPGMAGPWNIILPPGVTPGPPP